VDLPPHPHLSHTIKYMDDVLIVDAETHNLIGDFINLVLSYQGNVNNVYQSLLKKKRSEGKV